MTQLKKQELMNEACPHTIYTLYPHLTVLNSSVNQMETHLQFRYFCHLHVGVGS